MENNFLNTRYQGKAVFNNEKALAFLGSKIVLNNLHFGEILFCLFSAPMSKDNKMIKNLKIDPEVHAVLKKYCDKRGLKMYKFLESLILEKCTEKKDIYGEN